MFDIVISIVSMFQNETHFQFNYYFFLCLQQVITGIEHLVNFYGHSWELQLQLRNLITISSSVLNIVHGDTCSYIASVAIFFFIYTLKLCINVIGFPFLDLVVDEEKAILNLYLFGLCFNLFARLWIEKSINKM